MDRWEHDALGTLADRGLRHVEFWCVHLPCVGRRPVALADLIRRHGPGTRLVMLARRARCGVCGGRGAHVQPARPASSGTPSFDPDAPDPWTGQAAGTGDQGHHPSGQEQEKEPDRPAGGRHAP